MTDIDQPTDDDRRERLAATVPPPRRWVRAPGRVNLLGDHTDYHDGLVLPMAIDRDCIVAYSHDSDDEMLEARTLDGDDTLLAPFVDAARRALGGGRHGSSGALMLSSTVPIGAGLASSAAICVGLVGVLEPNLLSDPSAVACTARDVEVAATGVRGGLMDQLTSAAGIAGHALRIDCADWSIEPLPLPTELGVVVVHSGQPRSLARSPYAARREASTAVARRLGLRSLREARLDQVADEPLGRHVVSENGRVDDAVGALRGNDVGRLGELMAASHASLRDDYQVSTPELDRLVELLVEEGAAGARLTGAGFGGCVVAATTADVAASVGQRAAGRYARETELSPAVYVPRAVDGARELPWG